MPYSTPAFFFDVGYATAANRHDKPIQVFIQGKDIFVILPTSKGKSLCFATLPPLVFDVLKLHIRVSSGNTKHDTIMSQNML